MSGTIPTVVLPPLIGSRPSARELAAGLPEALGEVHVEAGKLISAAQAVADELVKDILVVRGAERLKVWDATPRLAEHLQRAAELRGVKDRLLVTLRQGRGAT